MHQDVFIKMLREKGFGTTVVVEREALAKLDVHAHPFEAMALVLEGSLRIHTAAEERTYRAGDVFHLQSNEPHSEVFGDEGGRYLVGRR